jgi:Bacterial membrane protein YfhO
MLNTRYIIKPVAGGGDSVLRNNGSLGPVWFVKAVRFEPTANDVMNQLTHFNPKDTAIVFAADSANVRLNSVAADSPSAPADTAGSITLVKNDNDEISYLSQSPGKRFAVFSEVYYNRGWRAWIDDHEVPIIRTNYVLRGLSIPPGRHIIRFFFRPLSFYLGRQIQWMASIIFLLMMAGAIIVAIQEFSQESDSLHGGALLQAA